MINKKTRKEKNSDLMATSLDDSSSSSGLDVERYSNSLFSDRVNYYSSDSSIETGIGNHQSVLLAQGKKKK